MRTLLLCAGAATTALAYAPGPRIAQTQPWASRMPAASCMAADTSQLGLTPALEKTVLGFQMVPDQKLRYQQLLFLAKKLEPMDAALQTEANKVPGCLSTVFVHATLDGGTVRYVGESDAQLTKGLVALLVNGLSGATVEQVQAVKPEFVQAAGLAQSLTPGRNNGFLNMLAMMKRQAAALGAGAGSAVEDGGEESSSPTTSRALPPQMMSAAGIGPVGTRMVATLEEAFDPIEMRLVDESDQHAGHAGAKGLNGESHFALRIVSDAFSGMRGLKRHQAVYAALGDDMKVIHALSIKATAPGE